MIINRFAMKLLGIAILALTFTGSVGAADEFQEKFAAELAKGLKKMAESFIEGRSFGRTFSTVAPSGDVFAIGDISPDRDNPKFIVRKYSTDQGKLQWEQSFSSFTQNKWRPETAIATSEGLYVAASVEDPKTQDDWVITKLSTVDGSVIWEHRVNGPLDGHDCPEAIMLTSDDSLIVSGSIAGKDKTKDILTIKLAAVDGKEQWARSFDGGGCCGDQAQAIIADSTGGITVFGSASLPAPRKDSDFLLLNYSLNGELKWKKQYDIGEETCDNPKSIALLPGGDMLVLGHTCEGLHGGTIHYARYSADGSVVWQKYFPQTEEDESLYRGRVVLADRGGDGVALISEGWADGIAVFRFDAATGEIRWIQRAISKNGTQRSAEGMVLSRSGNPVILAKAKNLQRQEESCLAELNIADGSTRWEQHYFGATSQDFSPEHLAVGADGNVIVCGKLTVFRWKAPTEHYLTLIKYDGQKGVPIWGTRW
jgi:outer membrane protein assembly factor BamB